MQNLKHFFSKIWHTWEEKNKEVENQQGLQAYNHPMWWNLLMENVSTSLEDQNSTYLSEFDTLKTAIQKISKAWTFNYKKWSVDTPELLFDKTSRLLAGIYQMSWSSEMLTTVEDLCNGLLSADPITLEDCLS